MLNPASGAPKERIDFSRIKTSIPIPNLIEVQKKSYERFLQMDLLPSERDDVGLQSVFASVFPITDFRGLSQLEFVDYSIGNWECKCGNLKGLHHLRSTCRNPSCGATIRTDPYHAGEILCHHCGAFNKNIVTFCNRCGDPVSLQLKYDVPECEERGMTYAAPLKVTIRLTVYDKDAESGARTVRDIKEQEVFFGEIPLMTDNGTFIINGTERVIVSQLHRSPGVFFERVPAQGYYLGKIIPYRGSWVEFEYDLKNLLHVRIDRKRKFYGTVFLRALGLKTDEQILRTFYRVDKISIQNGRLLWHVPPASKDRESPPSNLLGVRLSHAVTGRGGETLVPAGKKLTGALLREIQKARIEQVEVATADLEGASVAADVVDMSTGEVLLDANQELTAAAVSRFIECGIPGFEVLFPERDDAGTVVTATLRKDPVKSQSDALLEIYRKLRPGDPPTLDTANQLFQGMFFDARKYDFSRVGRMKFNIKLYDRADATPLDRRTLEPEDFYAVIRYLLRLRKVSALAVDDIDHLGNRRVRAVGELLENQFRIGLVRMERAIKEKMSVYQEMSTAMPHDLVNAKPVMAAIREFFGSSQLSQFMDQTNPLSEITHKRRLSALGPGGLSRERAGFEVRDVHATHYGRICPIETPEGPNIGLISSLSCYARINEYGFIESPYRRVLHGAVVDEVRVTNPGDTSFRVGQVMERQEAERVSRELSARKQPAEFEAHPHYLSAWEEDKYTIAQANVELNEKGRIVPDLVNARQAGNTMLRHREEIEHMDVSPKQLVSVATSLIPFLENDDANRALMGSNMQRQAVPLLRAEAPFVGTGMEEVTARDSGAVVICRRSGVVDSVDSERIIVRVEGNVHEGQLSREVGADIYQLIKFKRSNQNTCISQKPIVQRGARVRKGDVLADGPCTDAGELALGRNVLVAFMPWRGYNFEDAVVVSEKLVREDYYTSIHIEEFEIEARDTKLGPEEITRDIPNIAENFLRNLDESGVIRIGATVKPGDILVGKVTPKGETQLTPEEKLLRAIFGEKAGDVKDASLYCPPGIEGTVVDCKVFSRKGAELDERSKQIQEEEIARLQRNLEDEKRILNDERAKRLAGLLTGRQLLVDLHDEKTNKRLLSKGLELNREVIERLRARDLKRMKLKDKEPRLNEQIDEIEEMTSRQIAVLEKITDEKVAKLKKGDELPPGVIKLVKCYVAMKRKLSVGDKMAGRHGNKGVIAKIVPEEDMPHLPDGTPVEIVLNPLGVPSRMNVGQILETHLGWAAHTLGRYFATPVFDGAMERDIKAQLKEAGLPTSGKVLLHDGLSGQPFEQPVTVGYIYMMKLSHLVDDKIHARSIGPYSLITQQPLGGKAQFGGQRFGEMEVWALEAYGAAYILQELLTAKSDDVYGRAKIYEAIVKGEAAAEPGVPESFNVLIRELQSLCLDVELMKKPREVEDTALAAD
ncbi:MAG: DNA-directed RNA polymerase subunit beta [Acidobacteria bacterium]|nr:DNA-directed RNA polymerase subunit beta [Acidobacteriota bacterium]